MQHDSIAEKVLHELPAILSYCIKQPSFVIRYSKKGVIFVSMTLNTHLEYINIDTLHSRKVCYSKR